MEVVVSGGGAATAGLLFSRLQTVRWARVGRNSVFDVWPQPRTIEVPSLGQCSSTPFLAWFLAGTTTCVMSGGDAFGGPLVDLALVLMFGHRWSPQGEVGCNGWSCFIIEWLDDGGGQLPS